MRTPTVTSVRAKVKRAAAAEGFYLKLVHSKGREWREADLRVAEGYGSQARDAGLANWSDLNRKQGLADWLRQVLTVEELRTVLVTVEVDNSDYSTDYFNIRWERVLPDWENYLKLGCISTGWAEDLLGVDKYGSRYDRGTRNFTRSEVAALAPSDAHALALALLVTYKVSRNGTVIDQLTKLNDVGRSLFEAMLPDWGADVSDLLDAVEALVPQEAPAPVELVPQEANFDPTPAPVAAGEMPQALQDYLGRLLHEPKRILVLDIWGALQCGGELPVSVAPWAADVQAKTLRYAKA